MKWPRNDRGDLGLVVLFTKDNVDRLERLSYQYDDPPFDVILLDDSTTEHARRTNRAFAEEWDIHYHGRADHPDISSIGLKPSAQTFISHLGEPGWTLGNCRNYALIMAAKTGWDRLLMVDDDIRFRTWQKPEEDLKRLDNFPFVGANIVNMPDDSIIGYLFRASGIVDQTFLSGSYLGIRLSGVEYPFPNIYNEDWIWIFRHCPKRFVPLFGSVVQFEYDWTTNAVEVARFQELGETVMEAILRAERLDMTYNLDDPGFWNRALGWRQNKLRQLDRRTVPAELDDVKTQVLNELEEFHADIHPTDILCELEDWIAQDSLLP